MKRKRLISVVAGLGSSLVSLTLAAAGDLCTYPTHGQSEAQQEKDRYECFVWASQCGISQ